MSLFLNLNLNLNLSLCLCLCLCLDFFFFSNSNTTRTVLFVYLECAFYLCMRKKQTLYHTPTKTLTVKIPRLQLELCRECVFLFHFVFCCFFLMKDDTSCVRVDVSAVAVVVVVFVRLSFARIKIFLNFLLAFHWKHRFSHMTASRIWNHTRDGFSLDFAAPSLNKPPFKFCFFLKSFFFLYFDICSPASQGEHKNKNEKPLQSSSSSSSTVVIDPKSE